VGSVLPHFSEAASIDEAGRRKRIMRQLDYFWSAAPAHDGNQQMAPESENQRFERCWVAKHLMAGERLRG